MSRSAHAIGSLLLAMAPLFAEGQMAPSSTGGVEQLARSKETMVGRLLNESPLALRIAASNNSDAQALYRVAQTAFAEARAALAAGDAQHANTAFDSAMQLMHLARKMLPADSGAAVDLQARFAGQLKSVESLRHSYSDRLAVIRNEHPAAPRDELLAKIDLLVDQARKEATDGRLEAATTTLLNAERRLSEALRDAIGSTTVEYRRAVDRPEQIYREELARNQSFVELLPIAVEQLKPPAETVASMNRLVDTNLDRRRLAEQQLAARNTEAAIATLRRATEAIEDMLKQAGVSVLPTRD
jgi:hypothetical protein